MNERGSTTLEGIYSVGALFSMVVIGVSVIYFAFAKMWISFVLYEGLICLAEMNTSSTCKQQARRRIERALPMGQLNKLNLTRNGSALNGKIEWGFELNFFNGTKKWKIVQEDKLDISKDIVGEKSKVTSLWP